MQHEREPLRRRQGVEHNEERDADGICQHRFLIGAQAAPRPG